MLPAVVAAITRLTKSGNNTPVLGTVIVTAAVSSTHLMLKVPLPPIHKALQPVKSVVSDGVTATSFLALNNALGLEGVKSGI
jgi:hypothetical protein